jgi:hypothetical protein
MAYLLFILAGLVGTNGVPHFVKGITGEKHRTPFKNPSSWEIMGILLCIL